MKFIEEIAQKKYEKFYQQKNGNFMQSYAWGQMNRKGRGQIPHYVGMEEDGKLLCAALLLEKQGPFGLSYFYCPRGYLIDFKNASLLEEFTKQLRLFLKRKHGIYLRIDPEIEYQEIDENGKPLENGEKKEALFNTFLKLGYKHTGFTKNFENNQPRYTFQINLEEDLETLQKKIHKSTQKKIKKTYDYQMKFQESKDVETFYNLLSKTSEKDHFEAYTYSYYKNAYETLGKDGIFKLFELTISPKSLLKSIHEKLKNLEKEIEKNKDKETKRKQLENSMQRLLKEKELLTPYQEKDSLVICSQMCAKTKEEMWTLYIGNDEIGKEFYAVNRMYYEIICYAKEQGCKLLDLFGTTGDALNSHKNLAGIHNFKKNFGGRYIEWIGEFDLIEKKWLYRILPFFLKVYRKLLKWKKHFVKFLSR